MNISRTTESVLFSTYGKGGRNFVSFINYGPYIGQVEQFGNLDSYDKVIVTTEMDCPIDESTVLFVEKEPEYAEVQSHEIVEGNALYADDEIQVVTYPRPKYDYIVKRVAKSLNSISIAIRKVNVS